MKKKLIISLIVCIALACIFTVFASANDKNPEYNEQYVKTMTSGMTSVTLENGQSVPLYDEQGYTLAYYWENVSTKNNLISVRTKDLTFNFNGTKLSSIYHGDIHLAGSAKLGTIVVVNLRGLKNSSGQDITDFNGDNMFKEDCPLEHIFMPDSIEHLTNYAFGFRDGSLSHLRGCYFSENSKLKEIKSMTFMNARQLRGFYIPEGVTYIGNNGFQGCHNAFFVQDPYDFLSKPEVYYFPKDLYLAEGETFDTFKYINKVLVFSADNITITNAWAFENVQYDGKGSKPTVVFKGDVSSINVGYWNLEKIYFANENDIDAVSAGITGSKTFVFCNADGNTSHLYLEKANTLPTCTEDGVEGFKCFCGVASEDATVVPKLGHEKNELLAKYFAEVNGTLDYFSDMKTEHSCTRCKDTIYGTEEGTALFTKRGYSFSQYDATSFSYTVCVNADAIKAYNEALLYGIVVSANTNGAPITYADGKISHDNKTIAIEFQNTDVAYSIITAKLTGITAGTELHLGAYCVDNSKVSYLSHNTVDTVCETISHAILIEKYPDGKDD
jgi:hypothetical protein